MSSARSFSQVPKTTQNKEQQSFTSFMKKDESKPMPFHAPPDLLEAEEASLSVSEVSLGPTKEDGITNKQMRAQEKLNLYQKGW